MWDVLTVTGRSIGCWVTTKAEQWRIEMTDAQGEKIDWDKVRKLNYRSALLAPHIWIAQAEGLFEVAESLVPHVETVWQSFRNAAKGSNQAQPDAVIMIHFMLTAFSVENLLKAELVRRYYRECLSEFEVTGNLPRVLKSQNLYDLAKKCGLTPDSEEEDLLRRLTRAAVWAGRYPLPRSYRELSSSETFSDGKQWSVSYRSGNDVEAFRALVMRIRATLNLPSVRTTP